MRAVVSTPAAVGPLHLQGAHLTHWTPRGHRPVLFVSPQSLLALGKAIRGGVPIIFLVWIPERRQAWSDPRFRANLGMDYGTRREDARVEVTLVLAINDAIRTLFGPRFDCAFA